MFKHWIKNRFLIDLLVSLFLAGLFCVLCVFIPSKNTNSVKTDNALYANALYDFQIPSPSVSQLKEISNQVFVKDTCGYYLTKTTVSSESKSEKVNCLLVDDAEKLSITFYNNGTLTDETSVNGSWAIVDGNLAKKIGLKAGDKVRLIIADQQIELFVKEIHENDPLFEGGTIVAQFADAIKTAYETRASSNSYSGAFIAVSDYSSCKSFLSNYIPLGRIKDRSEFDSDEAFEIYNKAIMEGNYSNEISDIHSNKDDAQNRVKKAEASQQTWLLIGAASVGLAYLIISLLLRSRDCEKRYFSKIKQKDSIKSYRTFSFVFCLVLLITGLVCFNLFVSTFSLLYPVIIITGSLLLSWIINLYLDRSYAH